MWSGQEMTLFYSPLSLFLRGGGGRRADSICENMRLGTLHVSGEYTVPSSQPEEPIHVLIYDNGVKASANSAQSPEDRQRTRLLLRYLTGE